MTKYTVMNKGVENTTCLVEYEQQEYVELFLEMCDKLIDRHGYTVAPLYQTSDLTLYHCPTVIFDTELGFGVRRISPLSSSEQSALYSNQVIVEATLQFERGCPEPSHIKVKVTLECRFSGTITDLAVYSLPLCTLKDGDCLNEACATINAIYVDAVVRLISSEENPRNFINRNDFYRPALWELTYSYRPKGVLNFELHPYSEFAFSDEEFQITLEYTEQPITEEEKQDSIYGQGLISTMFISLRGYLDKMLSTSVTY